MSATLVELRLGGPAAPWRALGLDVGEDGTAEVGGVRLRFDPGAPPGLRAWRLRDLAATDLDGLETDPDPLPAQPGVRPLVAGATGPRAVDHVVALTDDLARTTGRLVAAGLDHRRTRGRMAFFLVGPALLELVERDDVAAPAFWGLTLVVADVDRPRPHVGPARDAVQPGRRIATVRDEAGLGLPVALITPRG